MSDDAFRAVLEAIRRKEQEIRWVPEDFLFDRQLQVFQSTAPYKCKRIGRRGGKSWEAGAALVSECLKRPNTDALYVTTTRQDARDIMDRAFQYINETYRLGIVQNKATGDLSFPNGSKILMRGAGTLREINKLRGPAYTCVIVDEVQNFGPDLHYLIDEVCEPAVAQFHGWISVSGTPPPVQYGPFWEIDQGKYSHAWEHFHWTFLDNPHIPDPAGFLRRVLERRGWTEDHPGYQREYLGLWVRDDQARAFDLDPQKHVIPTFDSSHARDFRYVMGIDIGYDDPCAYVVIAWSTKLGQAFVVDSFEQSELTSMEALTEAERFCQTYPISQIAIDATGGGSKMILKDWQKLTRLPVEAAQKTHKASQISVINGDLRAGKLKIARELNQKLINDLMILEWDADKKARNKYEYPRGASDHLADAFQYAYNLCWHHAHDFEYDRSVEPGSEAWYAREERLMEEQQLREIDQDAQGAWELLESTL
jgi:hypothetical protein